jgi:hypothetical protein
VCILNMQERNIHNFIYSVNIWYSNNVVMFYFRQHFVHLCLLFFCDDWWVAFVFHFFFFFTKRGHSPFSPRISIQFIGKVFIVFSFIWIKQNIWWKMSYIRIKNWRNARVILLITCYYLHAHYLSSILPSSNSI